MTIFIFEVILINNFGEFAFHLQFILLLIETIFEESNETDF
jgi:hypothetical protein